MNVCAECTHYSDPQNCRAPDVPNLALLVLGAVPGLEKAVVDCLVARTNENLCGLAGKWWERA